MPNMVWYFHLRRAKVKYVKTAPETVPAKAIQFKDIVCEYTLDKEGNPAGYSVSFTVIYQDTPPYVPGVNQNKDKYTVEVDVEFRANYNN